MEAREQEAQQRDMSADGSPVRLELEGWLAEQGQADEDGAGSPDFIPLGNHAPACGLGAPAVAATAAIDA